MYETFEHTADLGLRVRAPDFPTLLQEAAAGLFSMIVSDLQTIEPREQRTFHIAAEADDYLLFDWLNELLYAFDAEGLLLGRFAVRIDEQGLHGRAWGEPLDPARHRLEHEVKAITYHGLRLEQDGDDLLAELIVDI